MSTFHEHLRTRLETGGFSTEDALGSFLPLVREVLEAHAAGRVAPLEGLDALHVDGVRIWFEEARRQEPRNNAAVLRRVEATGPLAVTIVAEARRTTEVDEGDGQVTDLSIGDRSAEVTRPVYLPGYVTWEQQVGHHDPLTDVFSLGMILASLACGLDFADPEHLKRFVAGRRNLFSLNSGLHPVLAQAIFRMTEIDRHRRVQDLRALLHNLENYRDQEIDFEVDLARIAGFVEQDDRSKQHVVLGKLRERLFEISKRNRLLHFRATMQTVNLTHASVPLSFDVTNIRPDQVLVWNDSLHAALTGGEPISLNKYLNFAEALYLPSMLDRIMAESRRDQAEFGFGQLRLVVCFLHWANLKEKPVERFDSPLVLLPVELKKKKGIRDTYYLEAVSPEAEVNPVVRHQFKQLYDIDLPEVVDLAATSLDQFFDYLAQKIVASEPAVTLNKIDRPRIELIHDKARRKLDQYRRRARLAGRGIRSFQDLDYSYDQANYHPLGLTLFSTKIRPPATHLRTVIEDKPRPRSFAAAEPEPPTAEKERLLYHLQQGGEANPYVWNFDLCSVTLGNFKYRKMSLVRDYETLLDDPPTNPAFDATFSLAPRATERQLPPAVPLEERYHVVPSDPTQSSAIEEARAGSSYIIQGPPGTGKSQTITNLIADYVARGKRVLFVCEKRAAIDVVYARLHQCGLGDLCCLIHDSQTDKKGFVMDLKQTYEGLLAEAGSAATAKGNPRKDLLNRLKNELRPLEHFDAAMQGSPQHVGIPLRQLLRRGIELRGELPELSPLQRERLPDYATWWRHRERIASLAAIVQEIRHDGILAKHPLGRLSPRLAQVDRPLELITGVLQAVEKHFEAVDASLGRCGVPRDQWQTPATARLLVDYAKQILPVARIGRMDLLDPASQPARQFAAAEQRFLRQQEALAEARRATAAWRRKLPAAEVPVAIEQVKEFEQSFFAWLRPAWWRLRRILNDSYDFRLRVVRPRWSQVLGALQKEYEELDKLDGQRKAIAAQFRLDGDVDGLIAHVQQLRKAIPGLAPWLGRIHAALVKVAKVPQMVAKMVEADEPLCSLAAELDKIMREHAACPLDQLRAELKRVQAALGDLPAFLQCLSEIAALPPALGTALCMLPLKPSQIEAATADRSLADAYRQERQLASFTGNVRDRHAGRLERLYGQWLAGNAAELHSRVKQRFLGNVCLAGLPAAQLRDEEKELKKRYSRGRRDLEHEFGKSMRYKSIRDLVSGDSGEVIKDLKPVWLMSPLSVSDTLPMDAAYFDVVIFDEASQITLEEAVPSVFRAPQAIVVGDEMQLPPTDFFSARQTSDDDDELLVEEAGEVIQYDLASNSFLNHAAKNLPSTMLGWHYRSRSESLVSFSNWAFYDGRLLTVPEERLPAPGRKPILIAEPSEAAWGAEELLERSISFHRMQSGIYDKRRNRAEADYIAQLVRELLRRQCGRSIGIVAFSETQQDEIEGALQRLAQDDADFRDRLDAEWEREIEGQFVGLLVKNLENIQGDERDIIILSVCYGYGPNGKMLMNFGPINKSGGERRLNVAFSRAKHHMAVVSSIQFADITNDYNDGAACLKNYLRYSEAVSTGNSEASHRVLRGMSRWQATSEDPGSEPDEPLAVQIAAALKAKGYIVDRAVGQSHFRCDLAVRRDEETVYRLAILLDNDGYYDQSDLLERDLMRPKLLRDFGWKVTFVLAKDWYEDRAAVLERLDRLLASGEEPAMDEQEDGEEDLADEVGDEDLQDSSLELEAGPPVQPPTESEAAAGSETPPPEASNTNQDSVAESAAPPQAAAGRGTRRFEFTRGSSNKFWEITLAGAQHTVRFGRIGTKGQIVTKTFEDVAAARRDCERLIRSKRTKGYRETP
jgi:predicted DNA-binding WGR domain protein/DNA polymerase III delta prime subunit